jgi:hypothetical protein
VRGPGARLEPVEGSALVSGSPFTLTPCHEGPAASMQHPAGDLAGSTKRANARIQGDVWPLGRLGRSTG